MNYNVKKESKTVIAAVIFPANLVYFDDFVSSLQNQTESIFDLLLINDGCNDLEIEQILTQYSISYEIRCAVSGSPAQIRVQLIGILKNSKYEFIIFGDTDDFFSPNRLEKCIEALRDDNMDIVFNDLTIVNKESKIISPNIWGNRKEANEVNLEFLVRYNVLGLGNTAIRRSVLDFELKLNANITTFDWIFYLQVFYHYRALKCGFLKEVTTFYRQHSQNTLGIVTNYSREKLEFLLSTKEKVLQFASYLGIKEANEQLALVYTFRKTYFGNDEKLNKKIKSLNNQKELFWFEETICET